MEATDLSVKVHPLLYNQFHSATLLYMKWTTCISVRPYWFLTNIQGRLLKLARWCQTIFCTYFKSNAAWKRKTTRKNPLKIFLLIECLEPFGQLKKNSLKHRWENSDWYSSEDDEKLKWAKEEWGFVQFSCTSVNECVFVNNCHFPFMQELTACGGHAPVTPQRYIIWQHHEKQITTERTH